MIYQKSVDISIFTKPTSIKAGLVNPKPKVKVINCCSNKKKVEKIFSAFFDLRGKLKDKSI